MIIVTDEAFQAVFQLKASNPQWAHSPLRVYLSGKGCDGFDYGVTFDSQEPEDLIFFQQKGELSFQVVVDPETLTFVEGSSIQWVDDERGRGFLVENPNHKKFRGKFYKKASWKERLLKEKGQ